MNLRETLGRRLLLLDGATGTQLQARGLGSGQTPELWNIERREDMIAIHHSYYAAGADLVLSNTFGVNRLKLRNCPYSVDELVAAALENLRAARDQAGHGWLGVDIGPTGHLMAPMGDLDFDEAVASFSETIRAGAAAGADAVVIETMTDLAEIKAAVLACRENSDLPVFATMTFEELRIRKSDDFTDLEEGKRVSWSVEYCGIRKEIKDPKGTTIISMKETIERSREFLEALKKSKEKDPCCYVKPKVEMKTKGNAAYKGRFGTLEEARESDKVICLIPSRDGRIYELRKMEQGEFIAPKNNVVDFSEIRAGFIPALPKIPAQLMGEIIAFFRSFMTESEENEAMAQIYWDKAEKRFFAYVPKQSVCKEEVEANLHDCPYDDEERYICYADIHSHNSMDAFFSGKDDRTSAPRGSTLSSEGSIISTRRSRPASSAATALFPLTPIRSSKGWSASFRESGWSRSASAGKRA